MSLGPGQAFEDEPGLCDIRSHPVGYEAAGGYVHICNWLKSSNICALVGQSRVSIIRLVVRAIVVRAVAS